MTAITKTTNVQVQEYRNAILKKAQANLGGKDSVTVEEYSKMKNIDTFEAKEFDLDNDGKVSVGEEASRICATDLFDGLESGMLMYRLFDFFNFRKDNKEKTAENNSPYRCCERYHQG